MNSSMESREQEAIEVQIRPTLPPTLTLRLLKNSRTPRPWSSPLTSVARFGLMPDRLLFNFESMTEEAPSQRFQSIDAGR